VSSSSHIFLGIGLAPREAAQRLAAALGGKAVERDGSVYVAVQHDAAEVGGEVMRNVYGAPPDPEPDEVSALDGYDVVYEVRRVPGDDIARRAAAAHLFDRIVQQLQWPALLVDNLDVLVAAWRPGTGRTDFPVGTSPDARDEEQWRRYAITGRVGACTWIPFTSGSSAPRAGRRGAGRPVNCAGGPTIPRPGACAPRGGLRGRSG
jgi:hypothetical protein